MGISSSLSESCKAGRSLDTDSFFFSFLFSNIEEDPRCKKTACTGDPACSDISNSCSYGNIIWQKLWNIEKDTGYVMSFVITDVLKGALM